MASVKERAEAEADATEAEFPDPEEEEEGTEPEPDEAIEPEEEPESAAPTGEPSSAAVANALTKALDSEDARHEKAVLKIYGENAPDYAPCPLCLNHGFVSAEPPPSFDPDQRGAVLWAMGEGGSTYRTHPKFTRCDLCDGLGKLATGARNELANNAVNCGDCDSRGYVDPAELATRKAAERDAFQGAATNLPPAMPLPGYAAISTSGVPQAGEWVPPPPPMNDPWGRPPGAERYNQDPSTNGGQW